MSPYHFFTLEVFTCRQFGGNPLAVVLDAVSGEQMQAIVAECFRKPCSCCRRRRRAAPN
jgi:predicted PhzF superfamily epimerase YddE/YHI9